MQSINRVMNMKKIFAYIMILLLIFQGITASAIDITSRAACVMDAETGEIYYAFNEDAPLAPASMTKLMTAYIIYEKIEEGVLGKDTLITADNEDEALSYDSEASNVPLRAGESYSIDELLGAMMVHSACAACEMIGKYLCGSEAEFADLMNETVGKLGLEAYYEDASGLSDNNRISARSMAKLSGILINKYPDILNYTSKKSIIFGGREYKTTNKILPGGAYEYIGCDGLKTGTTTLAGCCLAATAVRDGIRLISVSMHSDSDYWRFNDTINLLNCGFDKAYYLYENMTATDMNVTVNGYEMPSFYYSGSNSGLYFIIEDLNDYGFDIIWDEQTQTAIARYNPQKQITPIPLEMYKAYPVGSSLLKVVRDRDIKVNLEYNDNQYTFNHAYSLGGYTAVPADELENIALSCVWNEAARQLNVEFANERED